MTAQNTKKTGEPALARLPRHIAIIMDGNGRWAKRRGLPRTAGHAAGSETFRRVATHCKNLGLDYLTVYAFSTENWKRPPEEVGAIMNLLDRYLHEAIEKMERDGIRLRILGDVELLPERLRRLIRETDEISTHISGFQANICINYGGRDEIVRAAQRYAERLAAAPDTGALTEESFSGLLDSSGIPDPELIIRTGGEMRLSNFLLWQAAYAELYFTDTLWPDFGEKDIAEALEAYAGRSRRFGGL